jgi:hypothetical protein
MRWPRAFSCNAAFDSPMSKQPMEKHEDRRRLHSRVMIGVMLILGVLSCALGRAHVQPNGWWAGRGPVVPHASFPTDCVLCHTGDTWNSIRADFSYDHATETGVALEGAHASAECLRCHNDRGPVAAFAARGCAGCHEDIHQGMSGAQCVDCHTQTDWRPGPAIANHARTRFPLVGAHAAAACWRCHPAAQIGRFDHVDTECVSCHTGDLANATSPDHLAQGWTSSCDRCHIPTTWSGAGFNHSTFPLTGQHKQTACTACHAGGIFAGTPQACVACHLSDYNGATNPNHIALGISTQCADCHSTSTWQGANFNHAGISNGCVACHLPDYNATSNPNHTGAGFPTSCETCHNTNTWFGATFQHSFPITSGKHKNFACNSCHQAPPNYQQFSCTNCHEHRQSSMANEHQGVSGYVWQSAACYGCHPDGKE